MWSNRVDYESPYPCGHFDTKIEVVTMKNINARFFSNAVKPKWASFGGEPRTWYKKEKNKSFDSKC